MIKDRNVAIDAAIQETKIYGLTAKGDTFYVLKQSAALYEYTVARVPSGNLFVTVDEAVNACTANHGDVIKVLPGHTENITTASAITCDVAGVTIIGYGEGADKPTFTFNSTDNSATWVISAASNVLKNIIGTTSDDGLTKAFVVTGDDCELDIEWRDTSLSLEVATAVRLDTANNAKLNLVFKGFTGGNAVTSAVLLDDCDNVDITIDGYGVVSTAWVNMVDVASTNVKVSGTLYTQGITNFTRDVVDTITGSTWSAQIYDASAGFNVTGGSAAALASDDVTALATAIDAVDNLLDTEFPVVVTAVGAVADAALADTIEGAAAATQSILTDLKGVLQRIGADNANNTAATTVVAANRDGSVLERLEAIYAAQVDDVATNFIGVDDADNVAATTNVVANRDGSILERLEQLEATVQKTIAKVQTTPSGGADALFTITGGPIHVVSIWGIVTTILVNAANGTLQATSTAPASTTALSTTVAINNDAAGTTYTFLGPTGVLTPTTAGVVLIDMGSTTLTETQYIVPIGNINFLTSGAMTGAITWYMSYIPSPGAVVVAA